MLCDEAFGPYGLFGNSEDLLERCYLFHPLLSISILDELLLIEVDRLIEASAKIGLNLLLVPYAVILATKHSAIK